MRIRDIIKIIEAAENADDDKADPTETGDGEVDPTKQPYEYTNRNKTFKGTQDVSGPSYLARGDKPIRTTPETGTPYVYTSRGKTFTSHTKPGTSWSKYR